MLCRLKLSGVFGRSRAETGLHERASRQSRAEKVICVREKQHHQLDQVRATEDLEWTKSLTLGQGNFTNG